MTLRRPRHATIGGQLNNVPGAPPHTPDYHSPAYLTLYGSISCTRYFHFDAVN
jgi:hypothetical protein